jgi:alkylhydroperoxidase/carboxymuconolactone decarboxylase family protein YurZ
MQEDPEQRKATDKILKAIEEQFGFIPVVNQVLSERPDIFIPGVSFSQSVLERGDGAIPKKERYLCAISAAAAVCGEYCLKVQIRHAIDEGATKDEILEAIMIGSFMSMTRSESYALRAYADAFGIEYK